MSERSYRTSSRTADVDRAQVHRWLSTEAYWALGRDRAAQDAAIDASKNFSVFDAESGRQLAYARVITDSVTFAWLCDVFVDPAERGNGVGVKLIAAVCEALDELKLRRVALATSDAHGLYEKFGFTQLSDPEKWMARAAQTD